MLKFNVKKSKNLQNCINAVSCCLINVIEGVLIAYFICYTNYKNNDNEVYSDLICKMKNMKGLFSHIRKDSCYRKHFGNL